MEQRTYHGAIQPERLAEALLNEWNCGDTIAQAFGEGGRIVVQIGQRETGWLSDEPHQAITLALDTLDNGLQVTMGQQQWYKESGGVMVGGLIGFLPFFFTFPLGNLFGGTTPLDERLPNRIWHSIDRYVAELGAATGKTQRLPTVACPECGVANPQGAERCSACGATIPDQVLCQRCGHLNPPYANFCNRCGAQVAAVRDVQR